MDNKTHKNHSEKIIGKFSYTKNLQHKKIFSGWNILNIITLRKTC